MKKLTGLTINIADNTLGYTDLSTEYTSKATWLGIKDSDTYVYEVAYSDLSIANGNTELEEYNVLQYILATEEHLQPTTAEKLSLSLGARFSIQSTTAPVLITKELLDEYFGFLPEDELPEGLFDAMRKKYTNKLISYTEICKDFPYRWYALLILTDISPTLPTAQRSWISGAVSSCHRDLLQLVHFNFD